MTSDRRKVLISIDAATLTALDLLAADDRRDRSHEIEALVVAEVERRRRRARAK